jgi:hypothetical protein
VRECETEKNRAHRLRLVGSSGWLLEVGVVVSRGLVGVVEVATANVEGRKEDGEDVDKSGMGVEDDGVAWGVEEDGGGGMKVDDVEVLGEEGPGDAGELLEDGAVVGEDVRLLLADMGLDDKVGGLK